ncbi:type II toxin-antitoxin system RelE/ParE family toxin [Janthinobacterium lividum]|uniref:type II toxin-antitoxin system RelE/ParE family toxin n=1 Tax=Janthinobacterium lividum TaxID=29581 RepID=UPI00111477DF
MLPIQWKVEAQEDLTAILTYIAQHNRPAALQLYHDIDNAISRLPCPPLTYTGPEEFQARANWLPIQTMSSCIALKQAR